MKKNIHILFLSSWYPNRIEPVSGNFLRRTAQLIAKKHKVTVLFFKADPSITEMDIVKSTEGNLTEIIIYYPTKNHLFKRLFQLANYKKAIDLGIQQLTDKPDLIHANVSYPKGREFVYIANKLKLEFVLTELSSDFFFENRVKWSKIKKQEIIRTLRKARLVLPTSEALEKDLLTVEPMLPRIVLPLTIDPAVFYPIEEKKKKTGFTFLHVSGLDERYKNVKGIIEAFAIVHNEHDHTKLKIVTDSNTQELREFIHNNQLEAGVEIVENKNYLEIAEIYRDSECFVLFSNYETFSCVAVEALASGIQLISTNVGVVQSLPNNLVYKVLPKEVKMLSEAMLKVLRKEFMAEPESLAESVQFCHEEVVLERLTTIYQDILSTENA
ncbi:MAG: glycosyltransferase [Crocinitomicaceae bacterium]